jgi:hypothetical protein
MEYGIGEEKARATNVKKLSHRSHTSKNWYVLHGKIYKGTKEESWL